MVRKTLPEASTTSTRQSPVHPPSSALTDQVLKGEWRTRSSTRATSWAPRYQTWKIG